MISCWKSQLAYCRFGEPGLDNVLEVDCWSVNSRRKPESCLSWRMGLNIKAQTVQKEEGEKKKQAKSTDFSDKWMSVFYQWTFLDLQKHETEASKKSGMKYVRIGHVWADVVPSCDREVSIRNTKLGFTGNQATTDGERNDELWVIYAQTWGSSSHFISKWQT